ncbi:hypothetical protein NDU88_004464 [Pleurodeles waltl]|uniref:Uncharacterized protein n=1 Tax=Pleurodeles waltl TaxID=8319 RepID=A0AAV7LLT4_PLEWA|nr:hypothetical protein NDU88_004464 [Pleurodeles waltl]
MSYIRAPLLLPYLSLCEVAATGGLLPPRSPACHAVHAAQPRTRRRLSSPVPGGRGLRASQLHRRHGASGPAADSEDLHKILGSPKGWSKITGKDPKSVDWGKDSSDKFYSLTEESDLSSSDHSFGESDGSKTSETGNKSSSNEPTVRQLRRQRKSVKSRPCSQDDFENSISTGGRTVKWDYSGIGLADIPATTNQGSVNGNMEAGTLSAMGTEAGMLQSIYSSIKELQKETRIESRRARVTTKRLQGTVCKVAKSCTEIEAKLCSMEERIGAVEEDVDTLKEQSATRNDQLTDVMWKLEDFENRQRRNNLRFLGIPEGTLSEFELDEERHGITCVDVLGAARLLNTEE